MFHVAVVDDEEDLLYSLKIILEAEGWRITVFQDPKLALTSFNKDLPDIIIMDIMMPGMNGISLCREVRDLSETVPIIFLSAKMEEMDRIIGLESGADDYLGKPFSTQELIVRIKVQKRRLDYVNQKDRGRKSELLQDGFSLNKNTLILAFQSKRIPLTFSECRILEFLMKRNDTICTREELLNRVYSKDIYVCDRVIDNHIKRIRTKIRELSGERSEVIDTIYGIGYRWRSP